MERGPTPKKNLSLELYINKRSYQVGERRWSGDRRRPGWPLLRSQSSSTSASALSRAFRPSRCTREDKFGHASPSQPNRSSAKEKGRVRVMKQDMGDTNQSKKGEFFKMRHGLGEPEFSRRESVKMYTSLTKIRKDKEAEPSEFEESVAQALFDLENTNQELKSDLKDLYINAAVQIDVSGNKKAVVIHVPYRLRKAFRKIHVRLVRELEKKFSGKDVILIATRRIVRPPKRGSAVQRPRSRTLTSVHEAMLEDVVVPAEIVGKRIRYRIDGSKIMKVFLDPKQKNDTEYKLETFSAVYRKLSGKDVVFEYPLTEA
nr:40S ribosomal protein S7 [Ipomoea batatas]